MIILRKKLGYKNTYFLWFSLRKILFILIINIIGLSLRAQSGSSSYNISLDSSEANDAYSRRSNSILLGELIPVNQINLQKGVHLLDFETSTRQWQGVTNPFDTMGVGSFTSKNHESIYRIRYAYPLSRYTYIGLILGMADRWEAELYDESGMIDPEIFAGYHMPWKNGNVRLGVSFSPSLGNAKLSRSIDATSESAKGNFYRGGWSVKPEAAITMRMNRFIIGGEFSYLYFGERTRDETVSVSSEALSDPDVQVGLNHQYLGYTQPYYQNASYSTANNYFSTDQDIQTTITGGNVWALKGLIEVPDWYRSGVEVIFGQVDTSMRTNNLGLKTENSGGSFQEFRLYGRYRYSDNFSVTPLISWMPEYPLLLGQERMDSTDSVWGFQLTLRSKFEL